MIRVGQWAVLAAMILVLGPQLVFAEDEVSLFLTPEEVSAQRQRYDGQEITQLDAIIYYGPGHWRLWVNGRVVDPLNQPTGLSVLAVSAAQARLRQRVGESERTFTLMPRQAYLWAEDRVVSGGAAPPAHDPVQ